MRSVDRLPSFAGEVSPSYGDGGVMALMNHDPSVRDDADTSPTALGRKSEIQAQIAGTMEAAKARSSVALAPRRARMAMA